MEKPEILVSNEKTVRIRMKPLKKMLSEKGVDVSRGDYVVFIPSGDKILILIIPRNAIISKIRNNYIIGSREKFMYLLDAIKNSEVEEINKIDDNVGVIKMIINASKTIQLA